MGWDAFNGLRKKNSLRRGRKRCGKMRQKRMAVVHTCSVARCKRSNTASSHLVTSQVFTVHNIVEHGKYYFFALDKKSVGNPEAKQTCQ